MALSRQAFATTVWQPHPDVVYRDGDGGTAANSPTYSAKSFYDSHKEISVNIFDKICPDVHRDSRWQ